MGRLIWASVRLAIGAALVLSAVAVSWRAAKRSPVQVPKVAVVAARPLPAGTILAKDDVEAEIVWRPAAADRIGRVVHVIGMRVKRPVNAGKPVGWNDLESPPPEQKPVTPMPAAAK